MERKDPGRGWSGALIALFVLAGAVFYVNSYFFRSEPQKLTEFPCDGKAAQDCALAKAEEFFKYGSLGGEATAGIPYELFVVLPEVFSEDLPGPGGYRSFGLPWEEGRSLPIGFSVATLGMERVTQTCAVCHTTSYRVSAGAQPQFAPAGPGNMTTLGALLTFRGKAAASENFDAAHLLPAMQQRFDMTLPERLWYRIVIIPYLRAALQEQVAALQWRHDKEQRFSVDLEHRRARGPSAAMGGRNLGSDDLHPGQRFWSGRAAGAGVRDPDAQAAHLSDHGAAA